MLSLVAPLVTALLVAAPTAGVPASAQAAPAGLACRQVAPTPGSRVFVFTCTPTTSGAEQAAPPAVAPPTTAPPTTAPPTVAPPTVAPPTTAPGEIGTPAGVATIYVDPDTPAAQQEREYEADGRTDEAARIARIADQPQPMWVGGSADDVEADVRDYAQKAAKAGARPLYVGYDIPGRDCGAGYSGGGAGDAESYRAWATAFAAGIEGSDAIVVLEPDAIPHELQGGCADGDGGGDADERYGLIADATEKLSAAGAQVYIDAGHPGFIGDVDATADALRRAGVDKAAGFSLNVANFLSTDENVAYGTKISQVLGGTHFVVDTSRNGAAGGGDGSWCNPAGQEIGQAPTLDPGIPLVDALLWVKRPGESDGDCGGGAPTAGEWYPDYALSLVDG